MGALHEGHLSLIENAASENDVVIVSIFVNPTQFNNSKDLDKYPRTPEKDYALIRSVSDNVLVYAPNVEDLYDDEVTASKFNFDGLENEMEGKHRAGHFDGVGTIVSKFFNIVKPTIAYFGEKDFQQLQIVKKLVAIQNIDTVIKGCPIVRENNGLAMSSRNKRLSKSQFDEAALIFKVLKEIKERFSKLSISELNAFVTERFLNNTILKLEYFEIADEATLKTVQKKNNNVQHRAFIAVFAGDVRLIDNMPLN